MEGEFCMWATILFLGLAALSAVGDIILLLVIWAVARAEQKAEEEGERHGPR